MKSNDILDSFIQAIRDEFKDENWDYLPFIADRVREKERAAAPIGEGFTPGEWYTEDNGFIVKCASGFGNDICTCHFIEGQVDNSQRVANARLIASAPTLYRENARLTEQVEQYKAEVTRLKSLIYEFADKIKAV